MKLQGKVVKLESGTEFTDKIERVYIKLSEGGISMYNTFAVPNVNHYKIDDDIVIDVSLGITTMKELTRAAS